MRSARQAVLELVEYDQQGITIGASLIIFYCTYYFCYCDQHVNHLGLDDPLRSLEY